MKLTLIAANPLRCLLQKEKKYFFLLKFDFSDGTPTFAVKLQFMLVTTRLRVKAEGSSSRGPSKLSQ